MDDETQHLDLEDFDDDHVDEEEIKKAVPRRCRKLAVGLIGLMVAIGLGVGFVFARREKEKPSEIWLALQSQLPPNYDRSVFDDPSTNQARAVQWLSTMDANFSSSLDPTSLLERYAMVLYYYVMDGPNSWYYPQDFMTVGLHHCRWFDSITCTNTTEQQQVISSFVMYDGTFPGSHVGVLMSEFGLLTHLTKLVLSTNWLSSSIPTELGLLTNLLVLQLDEDDCFDGEGHLVGTIPTELGALVRLQILYVSFNLVTGQVPTELGYLTDLLALSLAFNQLTGEIPTELAALQKLDFLYLSANSLVGSIPTHLVTLAQLTRCYLGYNSLSGSIPTELGIMTQLSSLTLRSNFLVGELPSTLGQLSLLTSLHLDHNPDIRGTVPTELAYLTALNSFDISDTSLSGSINDLWCSNMDEIHAYRMAADCRPLGDEDTPQLECSCCTDCCFPNGTNCQHM